MLNTFRIVKAADQANSGPGASGCGVAVVIRLQRAKRRGETGGTRGTGEEQTAGIVQGLIGLSACQQHLQLKRLWRLQLPLSPPCSSRRLLLLFPVRELSKYNHCYRSSGLTVWECCQRVAIDVILKGLSLSLAIYLSLCLFRSLLMHINVNINVNICASNDRRTAVDGFVSGYPPADDSDDDDDV